jgi:hypothetical protein
VVPTQGVVSLLRQEEARKLASHARCVCDSGEDATFEVSAAVLPKIPVTMKAMRYFKCRELLTQLGTAL